MPGVPSSQGKGDLFPAGTTQDQIQCLCELLVNQGTRTRDPKYGVQTYEKRTTVNGQRGRYRVVVDSHDANRVITVYPSKSQ